MNKKNSLFRVKKFRNCNLIENLRITLFTNNIRGLYCLKYLKKKKIKISNLVIAKKNLDKNLTKYFKLNKIKYTIIKNLKNKNILKILEKTDMGLVCGFPYIFTPNHFKLPRYGLINLHAGILPKYRGGSPLNWQIINNEKYFGISVIKVKKGIDTGDIICEKKFKLLNNYKIEDLHSIANRSFPPLLLQAMIKILSNVKLKKQVSKKAKYFKQRRPIDSLVKPNTITYRNLKLLIRAMSKSYPSPYIHYKGKKILLRKIKKVNLSLDLKRNKKNIFKISNKLFIKLKDKYIKVS